MKSSPNTGNPSEVLCSIEAENASLKVKIKQEYDKACAIVVDINKTNQRIEFNKRDIQKLHELIEVKDHEVNKLEDEIMQIAASRQYINKNAENLKKQFELLQIETKQKQEEHNKIRMNYETMIKHQKEIYNSYPLVIEKNNLESIYLASLVQLGILQQRVKNLDRQKKQMHGIQSLQLKSAILDFSKMYISVKKCFECKDILLLQIRKKTDVLQDLRKKRAENATVEESVRTIVQAETNKRSSPSVTSLLTPIRHTVKVPDIAAAEHNSDLYSYLRQMTSLKQSRSLGILPPLLSRPYSPKSGSLYIKRQNINSPIEKRERSSLCCNPSKRSRVEMFSEVQKGSENDTVIHLDGNNNVDAHNHHKSGSVDKNDYDTSLNEFVSEISKSEAKSNIEDVTSQMHSHSKIPLLQSIQLSPIPRNPCFRGRHLFGSKIPVSEVNKSSFLNNVSPSFNVCNSLKRSSQSFTSTPKRDNAILSGDNLKIKRSILKENLSKIKQTNASQFKKTNLLNPKSGMKSVKGNSYSPQCTVKNFSAKNQELQDSRIDYQKQNIPFVHLEDIKSNASSVKHNIHRKTDQKFYSSNFGKDNMKSKKAKIIEYELHNMVCQEDLRQKDPIIHGKQQKSNLPTPLKKPNEQSIAKISGQEQNHYDLIPPEIEDMSMEDFIDIIRHERSPFLQEVYGSQMQIENVNEKCNNNVYASSEIHMENNGKFITVSEDQQMDVDQFQDKEDKEDKEDKYSNYFINEKQVLKESDHHTNSVQRSYEENYQLNKESMYTSLTEDVPSNQCSSSSENNYSGKFSPTSDKHSFTTIGADNMDMINPFGSSSTDGVMFGFGNSVNQIFGTSDQFTPDTAGQSRDSFTFHFAEPSNSSGGFQLF